MQIVSIFFENSVTTGRRSRVICIIREPNFVEESGCYDFYGFLVITFIFPGKFLLVHLQLPHEFFYVK